MIRMVYSRWIAKHSTQYVIETEHLSTLQVMRNNRIYLWDMKNVTILLQFFLNLSTPNARIALENPNTCESIQADRTATVFPGCSSDILYTTFSTTLCKVNCTMSHDYEILHILYQLRGSF